MKIRVKDVVRATTDEIGIDCKSMLEGRRFKEQVRARQIAAGMARRLTTASTSQIGSALRCDHTTIMHSLQTVEIDDDIAERIANRAQELARGFWSRFENGIGPSPKESCGVLSSRKARAYEDGMWSVHG